MIVRDLGELPGELRVTAETWTSRRLLLARDGMGFSLHDTVMKAGSSTSMWYKHHLEAVYCISGRGELRDLETGAVYVVQPGVMYALDQHERHTLVASTELRVVCVFNPPLVGPETHDQDGAYPLIPLRDPGDDPYASRVSGGWQAVPRVDPCVYRGRSGPLSTKVRLLSHWHHSRTTFMP